MSPESIRLINLSIFSAVGVNSGAFIYIVFCLFILVHNVLRLGAGGDFTTKLPTKHECSNLRKTVIRSASPPLAPNRCVCPAYAGHTPKAFQIVQKYKFSFMNQVFGVLFFQRVQVPYERIENPNR